MLSFIKAKDSIIIRLVLKNISYLTKLEHKYSE